MKQHTRSIFAYVATWDFTGLSKSNSYMSTGKLVTHVDLPQQFSYKDQSVDNWLSIRASTSQMYLKE